MTEQVSRGPWPQQSKEQLKLYSTEFYTATYQALIEARVPENLAQQAADILDRQNRGELPCPLEGEDLYIVNSAHTWYWAWKEATAEEKYDD